MLYAICPIYSLQLHSQGHYLLLLQGFGLSFLYNNLPRHFCIERWQFLDKRKFFCYTALQTEGFFTYLTLRPGLSRVLQWFNDISLRHEQKSKILNDYRGRVQCVYLNYNGLQHWVGGQ